MSIVYHKTEIEECRQRYDVLGKLFVALEANLAAGEHQAAENLMEHIFTEAWELSDKMFWVFSVFCPVCEGNDVQVDGKPGECPACEGKKMVTRFEAEQIQADLQWPGELALAGAPATGGA